MNMSIKELKLLVNRVKGKGVSYIKYDNDWHQPVLIMEGKYSNDGTDVAIICNGAAVARVLRAYKQIREQRIRARTLVPCIKPIDEQAVSSSAADCVCIIAAEEHNIIGGIGSAACEVVCTKIRQSFADWY